ncbi:S41 family peptidase [Massilia sp. W12]|uniref:S41 family peptidase n=1 Tax=Massilia sp. W12 TaxID=3126507 RepID=UPI0030D56F51
MQTLQLPLALACCCLTASPAHSENFLSAQERQADARALCEFVTEEYAYFDLKKTDWPAACRALQSRAPQADTRKSFLQAMEAALRELYDEHAHFGTANADSQRLAPSHTDLRAHWQQGRALIRAVRGAAARAGLQAGMEVLEIDGQPVAAASAAFTPRFMQSADPAAADYGLQQALAGPRNRAQISLRVQHDGVAREISFTPSYPAPDTLLSSSLRDGVAQIRIHNALGNEKLIPAFDQAMREVAGAKALILDLRDTPSGGNSLVARALMGHFVSSPQPYQRHELVQEARSKGVPRIWLEYVAPRAPYFGGRLVVLAGPWTGSMGEGMAIGLHAAAGASVYGSEMAQLLGALGELRLPHSQWVVRIPTEKLMHVSGLPRESFRPCAAPGLTAEAAFVDAQLWQAWLRAPQCPARAPG